MLIVSKKLRDVARGKDCTMRLPNVCCFDSERTMLAHLPCGTKGVGMKGFDQISVIACDCCHGVIDSEKRWEIHAKDYLRALAETQQIFIEEGLLTIH